MFSVLWSWLAQQIIFQNTRKVKKKNKKKDKKTLNWTTQKDVHIFSTDAFAQAMDKRLWYKSKGNNEKEKQTVLVLLTVFFLHRAIRPMIILHNLLTPKYCLEQTYALPKRISGNVTNIAILGVCIAKWVRFGGNCDVRPLGWIVEPWHTKWLLYCTV